MKNDSSIPRWRGLLGISARPRSYFTFTATHWREKSFSTGLTAGGKTFVPLSAIQWPSPPSDILYRLQNYLSLFYHWAPMHALEVMRHLPDQSVNLIVTSPPFPLTFQKKTPYTSVKLDDYVQWFLMFAEQFMRLLKLDGSLVIDIGGVWNKGMPTKSLYQYRLLIALCEKIGFHFAQDFYWYNPVHCRLPQNG